MNKIKKLTVYNDSRSPTIQMYSEDECAKCLEVLESADKELLAEATNNEIVRMFNTMNRLREERYNQKENNE